MAKEQWHSWARHLVIVAAIVFAGGGYVMKINSNSVDIAKNEETIEKVEDNVHILELKQRDEAAVKAAIFSTLHRLETEQKLMSIAQQQAAIDITVIKGQVNNLTKDP